MINIMLDLKTFLDDKVSKYKKEEITFIGLGNPYRTDDGFGIELSNKLKTIFTNSYTEFDNLDEIVLNLCKHNDNGLIIFFDSADFIGNAGDVRVFHFDEVEDTGKHFHKIPIKLYMKLLMNSNKETYVIAIKPDRLDKTNEPILSDTIKVKLDFLFKSISDILK